MDKEPFLTKRIIIMGVLLGIVSFCFNLSYMYYSNSIDFKCLNGTVETHFKSNLSNDKTVCNNPNPYIYNNNSGFGVYLPNKITKLYMESIFNKQNVNLSYSLN